jgi:hypothetical protein
MIERRRFGVAAFRLAPCMMTARFDLAVAVCVSFMRNRQLRGCSETRPMMGSLVVASAFAGAGAVTSPAALAQASGCSGPYPGVGTGYSFKSDDEIVVFDTDRDGGFDDTVRTGAGANAFSPGFCEGAATGPSPGSGWRTGDGGIKLSVREGYDL